jgi:hypothetical protein
VHTLASSYGTAPAQLWTAVARAVPPGTPQAGVLFESERLPLKATTAMRLAGGTEDIWTAVPNPLAGLR